MTVDVYSIGLITCSACAPVEMTPDEVAAAVNEREPTGISSDWQISNDDFRGKGEQPRKPPVPCDSNPTRQHWLLSC